MPPPLRYKIMLHRPIWLFSTMIDLWRWMKSRSFHLECVVQYPVSTYEEKNVEDMQNRFDEFHTATFCISGFRWWLLSTAITLLGLMV